MHHFYISIASLLILLTAQHYADGNQMAFKQNQKVLALLDKSEFALAKTQSISPDSGRNPFQNDNRPRECSEILTKGYKKCGVYTIWPTAAKSVDVYCDMDTEGGGWTVIQRRGNFWKQQNFHLGWQSYKVGFGNINRDFWLGNDIIYNLTKQGTWELRIDLTDRLGEARYAVYNNFRIEDESFDYTLHVGHYRGDAGDGFKFHNGKRFSTTDRGDDKNCSNINKGGWWYNDFAYVHLNGLYQPDEHAPQSIHWWEWEYNKGLGSTEMKIRLKRH